MQINDTIDYEFTVNQFTKCKSFTNVVPTSNKFKSHLDLLECHNSRYNFAY